MIRVLNLTLKSVQFPQGFYDLQEENYLHFNEEPSASFSEALRIKAYQYFT